MQMSSKMKMTKEKQSKDCKRMIENFVSMRQTILYKKI